MDKQIERLLTDLQDLVNDTLHLLTKKVAKMFHEYENSPEKTYKLLQESQHWKETEDLVKEFYKYNKEFIDNYCTPAKESRIAKKYPQGFSVTDNIIKLDLTREYMERKGLL